MPLTPEQLERLTSHYPGLALQASCTITDSYFRPGVTLGEDVTLSGSRIGRGVVIGENSVVMDATIGDRCILGRRVRVDPGVELPPFTNVPDGAHVRDSPPDGGSTWAQDSTDPDDALPLREFILEKLPLVQVHKKWLAARGDESLRVEYPLTNADTVLDVGGFQGDWAAVIAKRYAPDLHVFEPVEQFAVAIRERLGDRADVHAFGLAGSTRDELITLAGESSSVLPGHVAATKHEKIRLHAAADIFRDLPAEIALLKINIEGCEYELLEHLIREKLIGRCRHLQVQFHDFVPDARPRRRAIRSLLQATHRCAWNYPFIWEGWTRL